MFWQRWKKWENNGTEEIGLVTPIPGHRGARYWILLYHLSLHRCPYKPYNLGSVRQVVIYWTIFTTHGAEIKWLTFCRQYFQINCLYYKIRWFKILRNWFPIFLWMISRTALHNWQTLFEPMMAHCWSIYIVAITVTQFVVIRFTLLSLYVMAKYTNLDIHTSQTLRSAKTNTRQVSTMAGLLWNKLKCPNFLIYCSGPFY